MKKHLKRVCTFWRNFTHFGENFAHFGGNFEHFGGIVLPILEDISIYSLSQNNINCLQIDEIPKRTHKNG